MRIEDRGSSKRAWCLKERIAGVLEDEARVAAVEEVEPRPADDQ